MNFNSYKPLCNGMTFNIDKVYDLYFQKFKKENNFSAGITVLAEKYWVQNDRPYYNIYPSIVEPLMRLDISKVTSDMVKYPYPSILFKFAEGKEPESGVKTFLASILKATNDGAIVFLIAAQGDWEGIRFIITPFTKTITLGEAYDRASEDMAKKAGYRNSQEVRDILGLAASCAIMDTEMLIPEVLNRDEGKEITPSVLERARRNGKFGWSIGRDIEMIPHIRRPHPCLVWTGEGKKIPKVIIRKGSIVHRDKVESLPSGFETIESTSHLPVNAMCTSDRTD